MPRRTSRLALFGLICALSWMMLGCPPSEDGTPPPGGDSVVPTAPETSTDEPVPPESDDEPVVPESETPAQPAVPTPADDTTGDVQPAVPADEETPPAETGGPTVEPADAPEPPAEPTDTTEPADEMIDDEQAATDTAATSPAVAANANAEGCFWPRFHGPNQDNISPATGLLSEWPADGPPMAWQVEGIGEGFASVAIADGRIYTAGNIGEDLIITALDLSGNIVWQKPAGPAWTEDYPGSRGTPVIDGNHIYYEGATGVVSCLEAETGDTIWQVDILERFGAPNIKWALAESVLIDGDHVICTPGGPNTCVVALDKMTGETVWQSESADGDATAYATPILVEYGGLRIVLTMTAKALVGVNADTGALLFRHPHETEYDVNAAMPIFHDGEVFVSTGYKSGAEKVKLTVDGGQVTAEQVWANAELDNHHGGVILYEGNLYGSDSRGKWICLDWETGQRHYAERGVGKGSLTLAEGLLYVFSENRALGIVEATPEAHEVISEFHIPSGGKGKSWAHPVVCGKRLYIRHGDYLYVYDIAAR